MFTDEKKLSPAQRYREMIREFEYFKKYQCDIALRESLESEYEKTKNKLSNSFKEETSELTIKSEKIDLFVFSVGIFTFGILDAAQDILDNIPGDLRQVRHLAGVLNQLLPMPQNLSPFRNSLAVREWLKVKYSRLKWDTTSEKYILENYRILSNVPNDSIIEKFNTTDTEIERKTLMLEVLPDTGINWVGIFQPGHYEFSRVYQHPNQIDLIVICQGQGYIINPESRLLLETFGNNIVTAIDLPESRFILFHEDSRLLCYDSSGFLWKNSEITWNSVCEIKVEKNILTGKFYRYNDNYWVLFWFDIKTGEIQLGEFKWEYLFPKSERPWWQFW